MFAKAVRGDWPKDDLLWQVQCFGETRPSATVATDLTLEVLLRWVPEPGRTPPVYSSHIVLTGIGQLPVLNVGQQWRAQRPVGLCAAEGFDDQVLLSPDNWRHVEAGEVLPGTEKLPQYLIPPHVHGFTPMLRTRLLAIGHKGTPDVILIPELEVARAWYFRSTDLVLRLTAGPLRSVLNSLYNGNYGATVLGGDWQTVVRTGLDHNDAFVVAMLRCDVLAAQRAQVMMDSLASAGTSRVPHYMKAEPPLDGERRLKAEGIWFKSRGVDRFLVHRLTGVPFPANSGRLHWDLDNSNQGIEIEGEPPRDKAWPKKKPKKPVTPNHTVVHGSEPDNNVAAVHETVVMPEFLDAPQLVRLPPRKQTSKGIPGFAAPPPSSGETSTGQGENSPGNPTPHRVHEERRDTSKPQPPRSTVSADFMELLEIKDRLNEGGIFRGKILAGSAQVVGPPTEPRSEFKTKTPKGRRISWTFVGDRPRQFMVLQLAVAGKFAYAIEIERRTKAVQKTKEHFALAVAAKADLSEIEKMEFVILAGKVAAKKGVWPRSVGYVKIEKLPHSYKDNARFAAAVVRKLHKLIPETADHIAESRRMTATG